MLTKELKDKLKETLAICDLHYQRMKFAYDSIKNSEQLTSQKNLFFKIILNCLYNKHLKMINFTPSLMNIGFQIDTIF